jgi:two-component system sensor histidine kinase KdpD
LFPDTWPLTPKHLTPEHLTPTHMTHLPSRPDPDQLLAHVQADESSRQRGQLKIFLGYAAGVGKTYAMLEAAHQRAAEGLEVVIGYIETHHRAETEALVAGLETIPRKSLEYHGVELTEMDVDAVLARRPRLALVDELAHTNAPGSRHPKRHQDVEELLSAGIDVYTTLNIQHLESLNDVVAQITGTLVRETIPDRVIDAAAEIELIDLPPDELLQRLGEGKVYVPEQAARAIDEFFRKGNLTALREMAMRRAAERVDDQMRAYMQTRAIPGPWHATERLLVCLSPNTLGERLVRSTRRLADELKAEWFAIYVETPEHEHLPQSSRDQVARTLRLAEELGARTKILPVSPTAPTISGTLLQYARKHNITKIVAGKPLRPAWQDWARRSMVEQLIQQSGTIDIYVISSTESGKLPREEVAWQPHRPLRRYLWSVLLVLVAMGISSLIAYEGFDISPTNLVMVYLLAVVIAAVYLGRGPAILTSFLSVLVFDFFFVPPFMTLAVADTEYLLTFAGLLTVGWVISYMTARAREQAQAAQRREADTASLYALSRDFAAADNLEAVLQAIQTHIEQALGREVVVHLADGEMLRANALAPASQLDETEIAVALWTFKNGESAGRGTNTLPAARFRYLPLKTARRTVGVLGVKPKESEATLTPDQRRLLEAFASQSAQAIERVQLAEQARQIKLLQAAEKLQNALLNSISHDLRTPLVSITGALSTLEQDELLEPAARQSLVETAREEADRLNRLVGNLLDMTRLESGALQVKRDDCDVQDLIGAALGQIEARLMGRQIRVEVAPGLPLIPLDFVLIVHVLINLLDNALKYSPENSPLEIHAALHGHEVQIGIFDRGIGIPAEDLGRIFDKFYRVQRPDQVTGTGLGLAISKGIIEAHGGRIWAGTREGGGTVMTLALPMEVSA